AIGGTHNIAHACQRIFVESGGKFFTKREVAKILVEHGKAKGIRLADGTEVEARKLVISTVDPQQLILELVGREHFERRLVRRIETLMGGLTCIAWYTWALHDLPDYLAAQSDPDVGQSGWTLMSAGDTQSLIDEAYLRNLGQIPPLDSELIHFGAYSLCDETRAPQGKHVVSTEFMVVPAQRLTERQWMDFKKQHAEDVLRFWQKFAPNMTWDNVIGFDPHTPYDTAACLKNMPQGDQACVDVVPGQFGRMRPTPELSRHRTPIEHLYATGCAWGLMHGASAAQGYSCYKAIADDLGLRKPWQEKGRAY
ncbi:MAG: hypothetical protein HY675_26250, partial [Chloroflexi bacterium]|nr:hypothetical protein [Chloroflexota bacterium]